MCFAFDARPPAVPVDLLPPIAGGAGAEVVELTSGDGSTFSAALAESPHSPHGGVLIFPDVRGLYPFYCELAERFAQAGHPAIAIDYFGRTAGLGPRDEEFEWMPHIMASINERARPSESDDSTKTRDFRSQIATSDWCPANCMQPESPSSPARLTRYVRLCRARFRISEVHVHQRRLQPPKWRLTMQ